MKDLFSKITAFLNDNAFLAYFQRKPSRVIYLVAIGVGLILLLTSPVLAVALIVVALAVWYFKSHDGNPPQV